MQQLRRIACALLLPVLAACATTGARRGFEALPLLPPAAFGSEAIGVQRLTLSREAGGAKLMLDAVVEVDAMELRVAGMLLGQRILLLGWDGKALQEQREPVVPQALDGRAILRDLQLVYWPAAAIRAALPPVGGSKNSQRGAGCIAAARWCSNRNAAMPFRWGTRRCGITSGSTAWTSKHRMNRDRNEARASLHEVGVICALGSGSAALRAALSAQRPAALPCSSPFWPSAVPQGLVMAELPALDAFPLPMRTRCNALLLAAYTQIEAAVRAAIAQHGAQRVAIVLGTSTSGIGEAQQAFTQRAADGTLPAGFHLDQQGLGTPAEFLAAVTGAKGPAYAISTACTSAPKAMASAARLLAADLADVVIAGGVDALNRFTLAGFAALECVSAKPCNPMSANRDGINMGEGAALFLLSREPGKIRLAGWGESSDAHHFSAPDPKGLGATLAMRDALTMAGLEPRDIDYINLHGTATPQNDFMESHAVAALFGAGMPCSSTKPLTGHALGAAGAIEAAICWQLLRDAQRDGTLPPHWWDGEVDSSLPELALVAPGTRAARAPRRVLSNSFAFGGSNAALVLERSDAG